MAPAWTRCPGVTMWWFLDSLSTDRTCEIATERGPCGPTTFDNWSAHQNWAVTNIEFRHSWVLYLDADERCQPELRDEVLRRAQGLAPEAAFRVRRKDFLHGTLAEARPVVDPGAGWCACSVPDGLRYERLVNPVAVADGHDR